MINIDESAINGHLLGDASIINTAPDRKKNFCFTHTSQFREYSEWLTLNTKGFDNRPIWCRNFQDSRTNRTYVSYWFRTLAGSTYTRLRNEWYPYGKKIIPPSLKLNCSSLQRWFLDDGGKATMGGLYLASDGFVEEQVDYLISRLEEDLFIYSTKHKNDLNYRIYIPKWEVEKFYSIIGPCPLDCFAHNWKR
jgi:hypothetical protein